MDSSKASALVAHLAKLFPNQLTPDLAKYAKKKMLEFDEAPVRAAIHRHRDQHEFISWPELWKACETTEPVKSIAKLAIPDQAFANVVRSVDPPLRPVKSDLEVILRHYRKQWHACRQQECYRSGLLAKCRYAIWGYLLDGELLDGSASEGWAQTIFWDTHDFQLMLDDLRGKRCELANDPPAGKPPPEFRFNRTVKQPQTPMQSLGSLATAEKEAQRQAETT